jgi:hypothetical protein
MVWDARNAGAAAKAGTSSGRNSSIEMVTFMPGTLPGENIPGQEACMKAPLHRSLPSGRVLFVLLDQLFDAVF